MKLRGYDNEDLVNNELRILEQEKIEMANQPKIKNIDLILKPPLRRALIVTIIIQMAQQLSGIDAVNIPLKHENFYFLDIIVKYLR